MRKNWHAGVAEPRARAAAAVRKVEDLAWSCGAASTLSKEAVNRIHNAAGVRGINLKTVLQPIFSILHVGL